MNEQLKERCEAYAKSVGQLQSAFLKAFVKLTIALMKSEPHGPEAKITLFRVSVGQLLKNTHEFGREMLNRMYDDNPSVPRHDKEDEKPKTSSD